jgi:hypothetical protein
VSQASGTGPGALKIAVIGGIIGVVCIVIGAITGPVVTKALTNKPTIPGVPTTRPEPGLVSVGRYAITAQVSVRNFTVDPIQDYAPPNTENALNVSTGDTLDFFLSCSVKPNDGHVQLQNLSLVIPNGFEGCFRTNAKHTR